MNHPEVKFTGAILTGMLKSHNVHLTVLSRSLEEEITPPRWKEHWNLQESDDIKHFVFGKEIISS